jgi:outer membrane protein TolC
MRLTCLGNIGKKEPRLIIAVMLPVLLSGGLIINGCRSPEKFRENADKVAEEIIKEKQRQALGKTEPLSIERPSDTLRRRLMGEQGLQYSSKASLGTDALTPVANWPDKEYRPEGTSPDANITIEAKKPLKVSLVDALQVGARNSAEYQSRKEDVFRAALDLDLQRNNFRAIFNAAAGGDASTNTAGVETVTSVGTNASAGVSKNFVNGASVTSNIAVDLARILTQGGSRTLGVNADTTVSIPLLGVSRLTPAENLTQAERSVVYEMWDFERYKRTFAVSVARSYFSVLRQIDSVKNAENNYRSAVQAARFSRRLADAGRMTEIEVDQAVQRELSGRDGWISAQEQLNSSLDSFKNTIGLPTDANITVDAKDMEQLRDRANKIVAQLKEQATGQVQRTAAESAAAADDPVALVGASYDDAGPLEMNVEVATRLALENRLDLRQSIGAVYDAQRQVVLRAEALGAGLTLGGSARFSDTDSDGTIHFNGGNYAALLDLDLPIERTSERNSYRNSLINLERATRSVQTLEDQVKLSIRSSLRTLLESRTSLKIQAQSVLVAEKRVDSSKLLLEAGRTEIRNLLEAQDSLLSAQNSLTSAVVNYRLAELELQRDLDLLEVNEQGLWQEFTPKEVKNGSQR